MSELASVQHEERQLGLLNDRLGGRPFVLEEGFSVGDVLLVSCLQWAVAYGLAVPEALLKYRETLAARPAYQRALKRNFPDR